MGQGMRAIAAPAVVFDKVTYQDDPAGFHALQARILLRTVLQFIEPAGQIVAAGNGQGSAVHAYGHPARAGCAATRDAARSTTSWVNCSKEGVASSNSVSS